MKLDSCCKFYIGQLVRTDRHAPGGMYGIVTEHHCWDTECHFGVMVDGRLISYRAHELQAAV